MKLTTRIDRLERRAGIGEPLKLTIAFYDSVLNETISAQENVVPDLPENPITEPDIYQRASAQHPTISLDSHGAGSQNPC